MSEDKFFKVVEERLMDSNLPTTRASNSISAADILQRLREPPCCLVCNTEFASSAPRTRDTQRWCVACQSFQTVYRGPKRKPLCDTCFNCVGSEKGRPLCAALKYQMPDGTWKDRYNQDHTATYHQGGMKKIQHPVKPTLMNSWQYDCECFEYLGDGETRESIREKDPLRFYSRKRFFNGGE